jgi:hypothetical protein
MYTITLLPQVGLRIEGIGQLNFGDSRSRVVDVLGAYTSFQPEDRRVEYTNYGCFIDFTKSDDTLEAVEFWNDGDANKSAVFIYGTEVLRTNAHEVLALLKKENGDEEAKDGWFLRIDVLYSGGNPRLFEAMIDEAKRDGTYAASREGLEYDLEKSRYFTSFGIGYKGYCQDGLAELERIMNGG